MRLVKIYIDRKEHESPEHTTGAHLFTLGAVDPATHDLWKEEKGKEDDQPVENTQVPYHVQEWDHFYSSQKTLNPGADGSHS